MDNKNITTGGTTVSDISYKLKEEREKFTERNEIKEYVLDVPTSDEAHVRSWVYVDVNQKMLRSSFYNRVEDKLNKAIEEGKFEVVITVTHIELDFFAAVNDALVEKGYKVEIKHDKENMWYIMVVSW